MAVVITGDIVNYTRLDFVREKKLIAQLSTILRNTKFEFYRGDSFQAYSNDPMTALKLIFRLRTAARTYSLLHDVRASIGIGNVNTPIRTLRKATGEAFILSGRAFDTLVNDQRLVIVSGNEKADIAFRIIAYYADYISARITPKQAEVVLELLKEQTQTKAAVTLKKAQATINKHAQAAGWVEIQKLLNGYKEVITQFNLA